MKRTGFYLILSFSVVLGMLLSSCTKKKAEEPLPDPIPEVKKKEVKQSDQSGTSAADEAIDDVNNYINNYVGGGSNKRVEAYSLPCGVISVDSTVSGSAKTYKMKYGSQTKCGYKKKSGLVSFQLISGTKFSDSLSVFKLTFTDYVVEAEATGDVVKINGYIISTNMTGGYVWESITANKTRIHKIRGSYDVTYANGAVRNKKYYHTRTWASASNWAGFNFTVAGDTVTDLTGAEPGKISEIGRTLEGDYYYETYINKNFNWFNTSTTYAGPYVLREGKAKMKVTVANISPAYFEVEAGYNTTNGVVSAAPVNNANSNTYKITTVINTTIITQYQLY